MRKFKHVVPFILAVCLVFSLCFTFACKTDAKELESLTLDTTNAKIEYSYGEEYRSAGLVVTATYKSGEKEDVTEKATIDSSAYDAYTLGDHEIVVSYSSDGTTKQASYKVNVVWTLSGGLVVTLADSMASKYELTEENKTVDFSDAANWIEVRKPDSSGEVNMDAPVLDKGDYTVGVYKNGEEVTDLEHAHRGIYQIVASMYDEKEDFTYEGFTLITVFDDVKELSFAGGTTTQDKGLRETMTPTWQFTVTYNSGDTEVVDKTSSYLTIPEINPNANVSEASVKVTYREPKLFEAPATTLAEVTVTYKLTGEQSNPDMAFLNFNDSRFENGALVGNIDYADKDNHATFNLVGGVKGIITDKGDTIKLPLGISINNSNTWTANKAYQCGGASSASNGRYIYFTLDRNCEVYVYARASGASGVRCMAIETEGDYAIIDPIAGYDHITGTATAVEGYSAHAVSITGLDKNNPAKFEISFDGNIYLFGILIIFPEDMQ